MKKKEIIFILSLIILYLTIGFLSINKLNLYTPDSTRYFLWAQSLSKFEGFKDNTTPEPQKYVIHAPLYSLLLSPVSIIFPNDIFSLKVATLFFSAIGLFLFFKILIKYFNLYLATFGIILLMFNPIYFLLSTELLSDVPFLVLVFGIFLYFIKIHEKDEYTLSEKLIFALLITAAVLLREIGISLMLSSVIYFFFKQKKQMSFTILIVSLTFYLLWIYRNEFLVARNELPDLTNSKIFTFHFFTSPDASIFTEFFARILHNLSTYYTKVIGLIFYAIYETTQFDVVFRREGIIAHIADILKLVKIPIAIVVWSLTIFGFIKKRKNLDLNFFINLFLILYLLIILIYPINDIRFLLPLLGIFIIYFMNGIENVLEIWRMKNYFKMAKLIMATIGFIFLIPNFVWTTQFAYLSNRYTKSPVEFQKYLESKLYPPSHFTKPLDLAGEWITKNSDQNTTVLGMWKDLACWIGNRKLIIADYLISPSEFDYIIRDYNVKFLISQTDRSGFEDFDMQISQSKKYTFSIVKRIGSLNIYRVEELSELSNREFKTPLEISILNLFNCNFKEAELILDSLYRENPLNAKVIFYSGVTKLLIGNYSQAEFFFKTLEGFPQAGMFVYTINFHKRITQLIKAARMHPQQYADYTTRAAGSYWSLGFEKYAYQLLDSALAYDSSFIPAYIFRLHFALKQNKLSDARYALQKIQLLDTTNNLLPVYKSIIQRTDSIINHYSKVKLADAHFLNAKDYLTLGVYEDAIDNLLACLDLNYNNTEAMNLLAETYILKRRFEPAKKYLEKILTQNPTDSSAKAKYELVLKYF